MPPWGQSGDISWHCDALDVSAERLTSPNTEVGHGRDFSVVRQGLRPIKVGFPLLVFSLEQTGINLCVPTEDDAHGCPWATSSHLCPHSLECPLGTTSGSQLLTQLCFSLLPFSRGWNYYLGTKQVSSQQIRPGKESSIERKEYAALFCLWGER